jgi:hypothetical protein
MVMPGASEQTSQVTVLNANWTAGADGEGGRFEVMIVTALYPAKLRPVHAGEPAQLAR